MEFKVKIGQLEKQRSQCLVIGLHQDLKMAESAQVIDSLSQNALSQFLHKGDFSGKLGEGQLIYGLPGIQAARILLVGLGERKSFSPTAYLNCVTKIVQFLKRTKIKDACSYLVDFNVPGKSVNWKIAQWIQASMDAVYSFDDYKTKSTDPLFLKEFVFIIPSRKELPSCEEAIHQSLALSEGKKLIKQLGNMPPNVCTPLYLAKESQKLAKTYKNINVAVLNEKEIKTLKMGALLSVAQGSVNPPQFITLEYRPSSAKASKISPVVLVGKAITFDTGGNSLKPPASQMGMKYDMCGGATVLGAILTASLLNLPFPVIGVVPAAENMPGGASNRPNDIVKSLSGQTIEILNTDAEGRLILCDALTYVERYNPEIVIDIATLTGACVVALGSQASGLFSNDGALAQDLIQAGLESNDRAWQLPLWDEYQESLASNCADMANIGGGEAGSIVAACFLSRFTKKFKWAHLDVAGTAICKSGRDGLASGRPLPLIIQYLINRAKLYAK
ncbi:MAG: pepA [Francisellaceae bacterium]|nr:pepA [Francisellaceae bacterium]